MEVMKRKKVVPMNIVLSTESRSLLEKLARIHDRSMTGLIEQLLKKEGKEYGIIEIKE